MNVTQNHLTRQQTLVFLWKWYTVQITTKTTQMWNITATEKKDSTDILFALFSINLFFLGIYVIRIMCVIFFPNPF